MKKDATLPGTTHFLNMNGGEMLDYLADKLVLWHKAEFRSWQYARRWMQRVNIAAQTLGYQFQRTLDEIEALTNHKRVTAATTADHCASCGKPGKCVAAKNWRCDECNKKSVGR